MLFRSLAVFLLLLSVALAFNEVVLVPNGDYTMAPPTTFADNPEVTYVNTDDLEDRLVAVAENILRFYPNNAGKFDNASAYNVAFNETIAQARFNSDGSWLGARGSTSDKIYFMQKNSTTGVYYVDHFVLLNNKSNALDWAFNGKTLAVGLLDNTIALLQWN